MKIRLVNKVAIKVGIAGLGRSGWNLHALALKKLLRYSIQAVCDKDTKKLREAETALGCATYTHYSDFLRHPGLQLIVVATPTKEHFGMARSALMAGKHVVLEKPFSGVARMLKNLDKLAKKNRKKIFPFFNFRFNDDFLKIKDILQKGLIGRVFLIKKQVGYFNRRNDWQSLKNKNGGILNAATIHHIDQVVQLIGRKPRLEWSNLANLVSKGDAQDHSKLILKFPSGCIADIEVSWAQALVGPEWLIYGTHGAIRKDGDGLEVKWFREDETMNEKPRNRSYSSGEKINWKKQKIGLNDRSAEVYYKSLHKGLTGKSFSPITLKSVFNVMDILDATTTNRQNKKGER